MAGPSIVDTLAGRLVIGVSTFVAMAVVAAAVAPYIRATGAPYANWLAAGLGGLVVFVATVGLYRITQGTVGGG